MKYRLTEYTKKIDGITFYWIEALKDFGNVKKGDLGGWIEKESNLSQEGDCWVSDNAEVSGNARICGNTWVSGNAWVCGNENEKKAENKVSDKKDILNNLNLLSDDIEEVVIKGIRYKKVTETKTFWKSVDISS